MDEAVVRDVKPRQQPKDLLVAQFHAATRAVRARIAEGGGVDGLEGDPLGGQQHVDERELVVDLVECVGVEHRPHPAGPRCQHAEACLDRQHGAASVADAAADSAPANSGAMS
jgi:hypothetical protein